MKRAWPAVILTLAMAGCLKSGGTIPAPDPPSSPQTDQDLIQGIWAVTGMEFDGTVRPMDPKHGRLPTLTFNRWTMIDSTKPDEKIAFSLDPDKKPPVMRKIITRANGSTVTVFLAYELQSDRLRICENRDPLKPPTEFTSKNQLVSILRRGTDPPVEKPTTNQKAAKPAPAGGPAGAPGQWVSFTPEGGEFRADFPAQPALSTNPPDAPKDDKSASRLYTHVWNPAYAFTVSTTSLSGRSLPADKVQLYLQSMRDNMAIQLKGAVAQTTEVERAGLKGLDYTIKLPEKRAMRTRIFFKDDRVYQAIVMGTESEVVSTDAERFLKSFEVTSTDKK